MSNETSPAQIMLPGGPYEALLFDMDGVLTDTASVHATAWKQAFDDFLQHRADAEGIEFVPFDLQRDYAQHVDGKPRNIGVQDFLRSRGVELPMGEPTDPAGDTTVWSVGNKKNDRVVKVIEEQGVEIYDSSVEFVQLARSFGMKTAVVSSSANTGAVLEAAKITDLFETRVDGNTIIADKLNGKPAPDTFLLAAGRLGVEPGKAVVFEDALSGVAAGKAGNFGLVVGVDRLDQTEALQANGADIVVKDLAELISHSEPSSVKNGQS